MIEMSVVLVVQGSYHTVRRTIYHLRRQTVVRQLELVLVASDRDMLPTGDGALVDFGAVRLIEIGAITSIARANATGARAAEAPIVAFAEDHSFPSPDWAARLIEAHREPWAAVGPAVENANPSLLVSWADYYLGYGPWMVPIAAQEMEHLPGHNSSYKRDLLLAYGDDLPSMLEAETLMHWDLRERGHSLYLEAAARTAHVNFSRLSSWLLAQYHSGRVFAGTRNQGLAPMMRLLYLAGSPLIPLVRLKRTYDYVCSPGRSRGRFMRTLPVLMLGLVANGVGQFVGHAAGVGRSRERRARFEFDRFSALSPRDSIHRIPRID